MKKLFTLMLVFTLSLCLTSCKKDNNNEMPSIDTSEDNTIHLVILAGQSGARGKAKKFELSTSQQQPNEEVDIIADGLQMGRLSDIPEEINYDLYPEALKPGFGDDGSEFGPELGIGETLASRYQKDGGDYKSIIVKYTASGSTFTEDWYSKSAVLDPNVRPYLEVDKDDNGNDLYQMREMENGDLTGPLTYNLYQLIDHTIEYLNEEGYNVVIDGAAFVHGEQDAKFDANMSIYEKALSYFIDDLREYVGNENLPVVVTEALTNSAKYSNELRDIQKRVAQNLDNVSFIKTLDLYTNTFEPWHFGAQSNMVLGNRIAAEIISNNDDREVESIDEKVLNIPYGITVDLPQYVNATFTNGYSGMVKVENYVTNYDPNKLGEQDVKFNVKANDELVEYSLKVNVANNIAFVDGVLNEYSNVKANSFANDLGEVYIIKGETGLYIAASINDNEVWTDGEKWREGDMGQKGNNDDFRVYITTKTAAERKTLCLSSANLLRIYGNGLSLSATDQTLQDNNLVFNKKVSNYLYHVTTNGITNNKDCDTNGLMFELYITYSDLGINNPNDIKLCFNYNDITLNSNERLNKDNYLIKSSTTGVAEEDDNCYFPISDLI